MRGVAIVLISSLALLGCHGKKAVVEPTQPLSTLKNIDLEKKTGLCRAASYRYVYHWRLGQSKAGQPVSDGETAA